MSGSQIEAKLPDSTCRRVYNYQEITTWWSRLYPGQAILIFPSSGPIDCTGTLLYTIRYDEAVRADDDRDLRVNYTGSGLSDR